MAASFRFRELGSRISAISPQTTSRILELAHIANVFDPAADDAHYTRFRNHNEKSGHKPGEKAMWEVCLPRLKPSAAVVGLLFAIVLAPTARSEEPRLSISGYDPVAYFTDGKPVQGKTEFEYLWHKLRWRFADGAHRELFVKDPGRYAPQYDGYCAMGVAWAIVDGKLYLTHTPRSLDAWRENAAENIKTANGNWSTVQNLPDATIVGPPCPDRPQTVVISLGNGKREVLIFRQLARDTDGNVVGKGDMRAQIEYVGKNIQ